MLSLSVFMLGSALVLFVVAGVLWNVWNIPDAIDEVTGKKRKRQVRKLQEASRSIGASSVVMSTTRAMNLINEEEELDSFIEGASGSTQATLATVSDLGADLAPVGVSFLSLMEVTNVTEKE